MSLSHDESESKVVEEALQHAPKQVCGVLRVAPKVTIRKYNDNDIAQRRMVNRIRCPKLCTTKLKEWLCEKCRTQVLFNVAGMGFCGCGRFDVMAGEFRCNEPSHILMQRAAAYVASEDFTVAVISANRSQAETFLEAVGTYKGAKTAAKRGAAVTILKQNQRIFRFVDVADEKSFKSFPVFHGVCIVAESYPCSVRQEKQQAVELFGEEVLKNLIVCFPEKERKKSGSSSTEGTPEPGTKFVDSDISWDAVFLDDPPEKQQVEYLLKLISVMPPVGRILKEVPREDTEQFVQSLHMLCHMLIDLVHSNIKLLTECEPGGHMRKAFLITTSHSDPGITRKLLDATSVTNKFLPFNEDWYSEVFVVDFNEGMGWTADSIVLECLAAEKRAFQELEEALHSRKFPRRWDYGDAEVVLEVREKLMNSRYREEVLEYLTVAEWKWEDLTQEPPK